MTTIWGMNAEVLWTVLKWVLLVLAAGFVGQFGKSLALRIIERRKRKRALESTADRPPAGKTDEDLEIARMETQAKIEKKRAKARLKSEKKDADN